jgi:hypothetical protein
METERDNTTKHSITRRGIAISQLTRYSGIYGRGEIKGGLYPLRYPLKYLTKPEGLI